MATVHDFSSIRRLAVKPADINSFKGWYKKYLMLGVNKKNKELDPEKLEEALDQESSEVFELLPEDGIESLYQGNECKLCADDGDVHHKELYAVTDLGHERENAGEKNPFGTSYGYAVPIYISCCKRCARNHKIITYLPTVISLLLSTAAFVLLGIRGIREPLMGVFTALPLLVFIAAVGVSMFLCALLRRYLMDKLGVKTKFDIFEIDKLRYMKVGGWVNLNVEGKTKSLVFADKLPDYMTPENKGGDAAPDSTDAPDTANEDVKPFETKPEADVQTSADPSNSDE